MALGDCVVKEDREDAPPCILDGPVPLEGPCLEVESWPRPLDAEPAAQEPWLRCSVCGRSFKSTALLDLHFRIHTGERPHQCPHCPKAFRLRGDLLAHIRVHTGERPFQCPYCPRTFAQRSTLRAHLRTHTGEKPKLCSLCPQRFSHKTTLDNHVRRVHLGQGPGQGQGGQPQPGAWGQAPTDSSSSLLS